MRRDQPLAPAPRGAAPALRVFRGGRVAFALTCAALVVSCVPGTTEKEGTGGAQGQVGSTFKVDVFQSRNGTVTSADGLINCGTGGTACSAEFPWSASVVLTAIPDAGFGLQSWAGDCQQSGPCVLDTTRYGADKYVVAVFNPLGELGHGNFNLPADHAPAYRDFAQAVPGALKCTSCHGTALQGMGIAVSCDTCHATTGLGHWRAGSSCTSCHGDAARATVEGADFYAAAAPPYDTRNNTSPTVRGVGAHQAHVNGSARPVACSECHVVPSTSSHGDGTVTVTFGAIAKSDGATPVWNGSRCSASYCHGGTMGGGTNTSPMWTAASQASCGACHGLPPPAPHTASTSCGECHPGYTATSVDQAKHVDGVVQVATGGSPPACGSCHAIPPASPHTSSTACGDCHSGYTATTINAVLHQNGTRDVIAPPSLPACGSCHGIPPASPHPTNTTCGSCHTGYTATTVNETLHANGVRDVSVTCTSCHGSPPATGSHRRSVHVNRSCGQCHPGYTTTTANDALHRNGANDWGNEVTAYDPVTKNCSSTCHGQKRW